MKIFAQFLPMSLLHVHADFKSWAPSFVTHCGFLKMKALILYKINRKKKMMHFCDKKRKAKEKPSFYKN